MSQKIPDFFGTTKTPLGTSHRHNMTTLLQNQSNNTVFGISHSRSAISSSDSMEHKALLGFLILFLGFSYALSSRPAPQYAHLKSGYDQDPPIQGFVEQGLMGERNYGEELELEEIIRGRMDIESDDYPGTGANNDHDPKTPGRS